MFSAYAIFLLFFDGRGGINDYIMGNVEINVEMNTGDSHLFYNPVWQVFKRKGERNLGRARCILHYSRRTKGRGD